MARAKKIDYASMFSYDEKKGLYYAVRTIKGKKRRFYAKDPEVLYNRIEEAENDVPKPLTFKDVAEEWKAAKWETIQPNTQICYSASYKRAIDEFSDRPIESILPAEINRVILKMKDAGYSAKTVRTQKGVLKMIFDYAITRDSAPIIYNPVTSVIIPRGLPKKKRSAPDDAVMQTVIDNVDTATFGLFPYLLLYTGCRRGEALALTWGDIDFEKKEISISKEYSYPYGMPVLKETKTEAGMRTVPLLPGLEEHLKRPKDAKDEQLIFHAPDGRALQENAYRRRWKHYCKDVGLYTDEPEERKSKQGKRYIYHKITPTLTAHQLRHGYATILYESKVDEKTAQALLGHADIHTTMQIYTDLRQRHRKNQVKKVESYMKKYEKNRLKGATNTANP